MFAVPSSFFPYLWTVSSIINQSFVQANKGIKYHSTSKLKEEVTFSFTFITVYLHVIPNLCDFLLQKT